MKLFFALTLIIVLQAANASVYFGNGIKIGEVDQNSAIIWTRLTETSEPNWEGVVWEPFEGNSSFADDHYDGWDQIPEGYALDDMVGRLKGALGYVRISLFSRPDSSQPLMHQTNWLPVDPKADFILQWEASDLRPNQTYLLQLESKSESGEIGQILDGQFRTAPAAHQTSPIQFVVTTCHSWKTRDDGNRGQRIYPLMMAQEPHFFVHTGDILYYDTSTRGAEYAAVNEELAHFAWNRVYGAENAREFHNHIAAYFIKDDHETIENDAWSEQQHGQLTWEQGLHIFREQVPMGDKTYRTRRWGEHLQIWLVEGRDYRSPNTMPDGPEKTIWGQEQKQWFFEGVRASDATFKVLISPTPILGPDRSTGKHDNHSNAVWAHEGDEIRAFLAKEDVLVICGDRHWQYASHEPKLNLWEFGCGPASDLHASGFSMEDRTPLHQYLAIIGGWLNVQVSSGKITFTHHNTHGRVMNRIHLDPEFNRISKL